VQIAEARLRAVAHRADANAREGLMHSVEHLRGLASGYHDEDVAEQMLAAFATQLRRLSP
jgi:hypothetical protein